MADIFDFIIVGGGTAGCLLAKRLASTKQKPSVLLVEAGGDGADIIHRSPYMRCLNAVTKPDFDHGYILTPNPNLDGLISPYIRGKVLGGTSMTNYMMYTRGPAADYDRWAEIVGSKDWAWQKTEERFKRYADVEPGSLGTDGPVGISLPSSIDPGMKLCLEGAIELGIKLNPNLNSGDPIGVGVDFLTVKNGLRTTSASANLQSTPDNLTIWTNSPVAKVVLDGKKAVGIETLSGRKVSSTVEVIVCAGAIDSPKILLLSGIGPATDLTAVNIEVKHELPGVGKNLQDHCVAGTTHLLGHGVSERLSFMHSPEKVKAAEEQWQRDHTGPIATRTHETAVAFVKDPSFTNSDEFKSLDSEIQNFFNLSDVPHYEFIMNLAIPPQGYTFEDLEDSFVNLHVCIMNPQSRGSVKLKSANPADSPLIDMALMQHPYDRFTLINGVRKSMELIKTKTYAKVWKSQISGPKSLSDEDIWDFIKVNLLPIMHANGSIKMGKREEDELACVDSELRVYGLEGLRVADLSVCPFTLKHNTSCDYSDQEVSGLADDLRNLQRWLRKVETSLLNAPDGTCSPDILSNMDYSSALSKFTPSIPRPTTAIWWSQNERLNLSNINESLCDQVYQIVEIGGHDLSEVCTMYFENIHKWWPVVSKGLFYNTLSNLRAHPKADFSLLLLTIYLLLRSPSEDDGVQEMQDSFYMTAKYICTCVQMFLPPSTHLVQAMLLLATFEHASGKCEAAYLTIGECARNAHLMGLHMPRHTNAPKGSDEWYILLEEQIRGRPPATKVPTYEFTLPVEIEDLDMMDVEVGDRFPPYSGPGGESGDNIGTFGREAQGCRILDAVIQFSEDTEPHQQEWLTELMDMDMRIRGFLGYLMDEYKGAWGKYCGATTMVLASFFTLHQSRIAFEKATIQHTDSLTYEISKCALQSAIRIVTTVSEHFNTNISRFNMMAIPPAYTCIIFRAAMAFIMFADEVGSQQWETDFQNLRRTCWYMSHRWKIAENYLNTIDQAAESNSKALRAKEDFGTFVRPNGCYSGLC
ncbi:hypothetical protein B7463_g7687, partial [Scytalidium lignicola]